MYQGYKIIQPTDIELAAFYMEKDFNHFNCLENEYVIFENENKEIIYKDNIRRQFNNIKKLYSEFQESENVADDNIRKLKPQDRYLKNGEFINRNDGDFLGENDKTLFNQEIQSYLKNQQKSDL